MIIHKRMSIMLPALIQQLPIEQRSCRTCCRRSVPCRQRRIRLSQGNTPRQIPELHRRGQQTRKLRGLVTAWWPQMEVGEAVHPALVSLFLSNCSMTRWFLEVQVGLWTRMHWWQTEIANPASVRTRHFAGRQVRVVVETPARS